MKYHGHVIHFLRDVDKIYGELPLLPKDLDVVILRPPGTQTIRFTGVSASGDEIWLEFLSRNYPGYRDFVLNRENLSQLPEDDSVFD